MAEDLDSVWLSQRLSFLRTRAETIQPGTAYEPYYHFARSGTLLRDAAAIALLLEDWTEAKSLFVQAGMKWTHIGLFAGHQLLQTAGSEDALLESEGQLSRIAQAFTARLSYVSQDSEHLSNRDPNSAQPLLLPSVSSDRQLLSLYISLSGRSVDDGIGGDLKRLIAEHLRTVHAIPVGGTQVSIGAFLYLVESITQGDITKPARNTLQFLITARAMMLARARADSYHWNLGQAPASIVDIDFLSLCVAAVEADAVSVLLELLDQQDDPLVSLPLTAATNLKIQSGPTPFSGPQVGY